MKARTPQVASVFVVLALIAAMAPPDLIVKSAPTTANLLIVADAAVSERWPDDNWGTLDYLRVRSSSVAGELDCRSYLRADLASIAPGAKVMTANLKLYMFDPPSASRTYLCWRAAASWVETTITWNTRPMVDSTLGYDSVTATIGTSAGWVTWDVKNTVQKFLARDAATYVTNTGWYIRDSSEGSPTTYQADFRSREYTDANYRPMLETGYYAPALHLDLSATTLAAGNWVKMTVTRKDYDGNLVTRGSLWVDLSSTSTSPNKKFAYTAGGASITTALIPNGASSRDFYYYDEKVGTWTVGVSTDDYSNYGSDSKPITVTAGAPAALDLTPPSTTIAAGVQYSSFTVTAKDAFGQTTTASSPIIVGLSTNSPTGSFRAVGGSTPISQVTIPAGQSLARFDYYDLSGGTWTITVSSSGLISDTSSVTVIPDTVAPTTSLSIGTPKYISGATTYIGTTTQLTLAGVDNPGGSGVKETRYRVDGGGWSTYSGPFTLASYSQGAHTIGYMSVDNALNSEAEKTATVFLDKERPSVNLISPTGAAGTIWVTSLSIRFEASVTDDGSGIDVATFIVDGGEIAGTLTGTSFTLTTALTEGAHTWTVQARDKVGNVQQPAPLTVTIRLDTTGPTISGIAISPPAPVHGDPVIVSANIEDVGSGVQTAVLKYSTDGTTWSTVAMTVVSGTLCQGTIPGQNIFSNVSYYVQATDRLGNPSQSATSSYQVQIPPLWLYAGGGLILLLVALILIRALTSRPSPQPMAQPPPPSA